MKKVFIVFTVMCSLLCAAASSRADLFSNTVDFSGTGTDSGRTYLQLSGSGSLFDYSYSHLVTFSPPASAITSAQLTLSHKDNSGSGELWILYGGASELIGQLDKSNSNWVDQVFVLPSSLYDQVSGGTWTLALKLEESTNGTDTLKIDKSVLSGVYAPVPVPPALFLFGSGLPGLLLLRRRKADT